MTMNKEFTEDSIATITISANGQRGGFDVEILSTYEAEDGLLDLVEDLRHFMNLQDIAKFVHQISK